MEIVVRVARLFELWERLNRPFRSWKRSAKSSKRDMFVSWIKIYAIKCPWKTSSKFLLKFDRQSIFSSHVPESDQIIYYFIIRLPCLLSGASINIYKCFKICQRGIIRFGKPYFCSVETNDHFFNLAAESSKQSIFCAALITIFRETKPQNPSNI